MTKKHRDRFLLSIAVTTVVIGVLTAPIAASAGPIAALGVAALTAIPALLLLGVIAYVVRGKDAEQSSGPTEVGSASRL